MEQCALQYTLKAERGLRIPVLVGHQQGCVLIDEQFKLGFQ